MQDISMNTTLAYTVSGLNLLTHTLGVCLCPSRSVIRVSLSDAIIISPSICIFFGLEKARFQKPEANIYIFFNEGMKIKNEDPWQFILVMSDVYCALLCYYLTLLKYSNLQICKEIFAKLKLLCGSFFKLG